MAVSSLEDHLGFWMRKVSNHVSQAFAERIAGKGVTVAEWCLLRTLYGREPAAPSRLAHDMGMTRGAITRLADRLIAKALVIRAADERDGRGQTLVLSVRGAALVPQLAMEADENEETFFASLSAEERGTLEHLLRRIAAHGRMTEVPCS
jgi:DNA-binding MarR family transcriptional regulator